MSYLDVDDGLGSKNWSSMLTIGSVVKEQGLPFVWGGDWNNEAEAIRKTGWCDRLRSDFQYLSDWTCKAITREGGSTIDMFLVDFRLQSMVDKCEPDRDHPGTPHRPVFLNLRSRTQDMYSWSFDAPTRFPPRMNIGCARATPSHIYIYMTNS